MSADVSSYISVSIKFFFLLTPFFSLSMFLAMTDRMAEKERRSLALRVLLATVAAGLTLFFFGNAIFALFGITLDAFRIGAGALLFLSSVDLVRGGHAARVQEVGDDIAVVPLAIPITIGPATTGALLVMGAEASGGMARLIGAGGLATAAFAVGGILLLAARVERLLGRRGIAILSKLTGLILAALAAQMICTGIAHFLAARGGGS